MRELGISEGISCTGYRCPARSVGCGVGCRMQRGMRCRMRCRMLHGMRCGMQDATQGATGGATQVVAQDAARDAARDGMGSSLKLWPSLACVTPSHKAPLLPSVQPGSHSHPPRPLPAESPLPQVGREELGGPGAGGAELWEREAPTVTRTTGCSPEPLVAAAASLQTSPGTAGAPLPPNPQPGGMLSPSSPPRHSSEKHWRPPPSRNNAFPSCPG